MSKANFKVSVVCMDASNVPAEVRKALEKVDFVQRHFFHGDISDDGGHWFDAFADDFKPLPAPGGDDHHFRKAERTRRVLQNSKSGRYFRPDGAPNVFGVESNG